MTDETTGKRRHIERKRGETHPGHEEWTRDQCFCVDQATYERDEDDAMWSQDRAGAHHWGIDPDRAFDGRKAVKAWTTPASEVQGFIERSLATRPDGVCWFWWANCLAPMHAQDTPERLYLRWMEWKEAQYRGTLPDLMWRWAMGFSQ